MAILDIFTPLNCTAIYQAISFKQKGVNLASKASLGEIAFSWHYLTTRT